MKAPTTTLILLFSTLFVKVLPAAVTRNTNTTMLETAAPPPPPRGYATVVPSLFNSLGWYYQYASSAYQDRCDYPNGQTLIGYFNSGGTQGFVARDDNIQEIVVAFRGTDELRDLITDANIGLVQFNVQTASGFWAPREVEVHGGFLNGWNSVAGRVAHLINTTLWNHPHYSIKTTGHSLGGALASIAGLTLEYRFGEYRIIGDPAIYRRRIQVYTYGQPRTGNYNYTDLISRNLGASNLFRVVNADDIIPHTPNRFLQLPGGPRVSTGYIHHGTEFWIFNGVPDASNTYQCPRIEDPNCSNGFRPSPDITASGPHRTYFNIRGEGAFCRR